MLLLLSGCALTTLMTSGRSLPELEGQLEAPGLAGPAEIIRDERGIPHIRANSEADAAYSVGFVHAQDRLFQLDLARRLAYGRLAEILGPDAVPLDIFMRSLGLQEQAVEAMKAMDADTRFVLAAYSSGVNAGRDSAKKPPLEHRLLDQRKVEDWTPTDSMAVVFLNNWWLSRNADEELFAWLNRKELSRDDLDALFGLYDETTGADPYWEGIRKTRSGGLSEPFSAFMGTMSGIAAEGQASNNWVISGDRTESGKPILANDPHLVRSVPATWYVADIKGGSWHAAGGTVPGLPYVVVGHNETLAWGATNVMIDYVDFVVLERDGTLGYFHQGEKKTLVEKTVEIVVAGEELPRTETVYLSDVGPVVTDLAGTHLLAMQWSALTEVDNSASLVRQINLAATVEEASQIPTAGANTGLNFVFADSEGSIGWSVTGRAPKRLAHSGLLPYPGSSEHHGWDGYWETLPQEVDPERGYIVTANSRPEYEVDPEAEVVLPTPEELSNSYIKPFRKDRISELIEATPKHTPESVMAIQMDIQDGQARQQVPALLDGLDSKTEGGIWVKETLTAWDYEANGRGVESLVWAEYNKQLVEYALEDTLSKAGVQTYLETCSAGGTLVDVEGGLEHFVADADMARRAALLETHKSLTESFGESTSGWRWEYAHTLTFEHPFVQAGAPASLNAGFVDDGHGSPNTVNAAGYAWDQGYEMTWIPSMRLIVPLDDVGNATVVVPPGQSGQPGSDNYQDQVRYWKNGEQLPLWFHDADVEREAAYRLELTP